MKTPREELYAQAVVMLEACQQALRIATDMGDQPLVGLLVEQQTKIEALVEAVRP